MSAFSRLPTCDPLADARGTARGNHPQEQAAAGDDAGRQAEGGSARRDGESVFEYGVAQMLGLPASRGRSLVTAVAVAGPAFPLPVAALGLEGPAAEEPPAPEGAPAPSAADVRRAARAAARTADRARADACLGGLPAPVTYDAWLAAYTASGAALPADLALLHLLGPELLPEGFEASIPEEALVAAFSHTLPRPDQRDQGSVLLQRASRHLGVGSPAAFVAWVRRHRASFAPDVLRDHATLPETSPFQYPLWYAGAASDRSATAHGRLRQALCAMPVEAWGAHWSLQDRPRGVREWPNEGQLLRPLVWDRLAPAAARVAAAVRLQAHASALLRRRPDGASPLEVADLVLLLAAAPELPRATLRSLLPMLSGPDATVGVRRLMASGHAAAILDVLTDEAVRTSDTPSRGLLRALASNWLASVPRDATDEPPEAVTELACAVVRAADCAKPWPCPMPDAWARRVGDAVQRAVPVNASVRRVAMGLLQAHQREIDVATEPMVAMGGVRRASQLLEAVQPRFTPPLDPATVPSGARWEVPALAVQDVLGDSTYPWRVRPPRTGAESGAVVDAVIAATEVPQELEDVVDTMLRTRAEDRHVRDLAPVMVVEPRPAWLDAVFRRDCVKRLSTDHRVALIKVCVEQGALDRAVALAVSLDAPLTPGNGLNLLRDLTAGSPAFARNWVLKAGRAPGTATFTAMLCCPPTHFGDTPTDQLVAWASVARGVGRAGDVSAYALEAATPFLAAGVVAQDDAGIHALETVVGLLGRLRRGKTVPPALPGLATSLMACSRIWQGTRPPAHASELFRAVAVAPDHENLGAPCKGMQAAVAACLAGGPENEMKSLTEALVRLGTARNGMDADTADSFLDAEPITSDLQAWRFGRVARVTALVGVLSERGALVVPLRAQPIAMHLLRAHRLVTVLAAPQGADKTAMLRDIVEAERLWGVYSLPDGWRSMLLTACVHALEAAKIFDEVPDALEQAIALAFDPRHRLAGVCAGTQSHAAGASSAVYAVADRLNPPRAATLLAREVEAGERDPARGPVSFVRMVAAMLAAGRAPDAAMAALSTRFERPLPPPVAGADPFEDAVVHLVGTAHLAPHAGAEATRGLQNLRVWLEAPGRVPLDLVGGLTTLTAIVTNYVADTSAAREFWEAVGGCVAGLDGLLSRGVEEGLGSPSQWQALMRANRVLRLVVTSPTWVQSAPAATCTALVGRIDLEELKRLLDSEDARRALERNDPGLAQAAVVHWAAHLVRFANTIFDADDPQVSGYMHVALTQILRHPEAAHAVSDPLMQVASMLMMPPCGRGARLPPFPDLMERARSRAPLGLRAFLVRHSGAIAAQLAVAAPRSPVELGMMLLLLALLQPPPVDPPADAGAHGAHWPKDLEDAAVGILPADGHIGAIPGDRAAALIHYVFGMAAERLGVPEGVMVDAAKPLDAAVRGQFPETGRRADQETVVRRAHLMRRTAQERGKELIDAASR